MFEFLKTYGRRVLEELPPNLISDWFFYGRWRREGRALPTTPPIAPGQTAPPAQPELRRQFAALGFDDEAAVGMVLADLTVDEAVEIKNFYESLDWWNKVQFKDVLSTIPTVTERAQQLKLLAQVPRDPNPANSEMHAVATTFQFIKGEPSLADRGMEWLRQHVPQMWQQLQQRSNVWAGSLTQRANVARARTQALHANPPQYAWDPRVERQNMNWIRRTIRTLTGL